MAEQEVFSVVYYIVTAAGNVYCVEVVKLLERTEIRMGRVAFSNRFRWNST